MHICHSEAGYHPTDPLERLNDLWLDTMWPIHPESLSILPSALKEIVLQQLFIHAADCPWDMLEKMLSVLSHDAFFEMIYVAKKEYPGLKYMINNSFHITNPDLVYIGPGTEIGAGSHIIGPTYIGAGSKIGKQSIVDTVCLGDGAKIKPLTFVQQVITGRSCDLNTAEFKQPVFCDGASAHGARVNNSFIGENTSLSTVTTANYAGGKPIQSEIAGKRRMISTKYAGTCAGNNTVVRMSCMTQPGVLIGDRCTIDNGAIVSANLPDYSYLQVTQTQEQFDKRARNK